MESARREAVYLQTVGRLVLLLIVPIGLGIFMLLFAEMVERRDQWVQHTLLVQVSLEHLATDIRTAEDSGRGYLLTGDTGFLTACRAAERSSRKQASVLAGMTADNPRQRDNIARVLPFLNERFSFLDSLMEAYGKRGLDAGIARKAIDQQRPEAGSVQAIFDAMRAEEKRLLDLRQGELASARKRFYWAFSVGYGLMVFLVVSLFLSVRRYSLQSEGAQARLSQLNEQLEERVRERTALLNTREELLNTFVRYVPAGVAMLDRDMRYLQVSERWCTELGVSRADTLGALHYQLFPDIPDRWLEIHRRCLSGETLRAEEDPWTREDGRLVWLRWEVRPWGSANGRPEGMLVFSEDITARKHTEEALRESEATIRTLLDTASQAIIAVDSGGSIVIANRMVGEMFGYSPDELIGKPLELLVPERLRSQHRVHRQAFHANANMRMMGTGLELFGRRRDGTEFPIEVSLSSLPTKHGQLGVSFVSDITARRKAETDLRESEQKLRSLAASLLTAQEDERRTLARELHDDVTQCLALLSIELGRLAGDCPGGSPERERLEALQQQAVRLSNEVRRLSHGLHPSVIVDFGLSTALEDFCGEYEKATGIHVHFNGTVDDSRLSGLGATCLYRVAQESLRNALAHGHPTEILVALRVVDNEIELTVKDNGIGFSFDPFHSRTGLGIVSMMERIRLVNGTLSIHSQPGEGCLVTARVPVVRVQNDESENPAG